MLNHNKYKEFMLKILIRIFLKSTQRYSCLQGRNVSFSLLWFAKALSIDIDLDLLDHSKEADLLEIM